MMLNELSLSKNIAWVVKRSMKKPSSMTELEDFHEKNKVKTDKAFDKMFT